MEAELREKLDKYVEEYEALNVLLDEKESLRALELKNEERNMLFAIWRKDGRFDNSSRGNAQQKPRGQERFTTKDSGNTYNKPVYTGNNNYGPSTPLQSFGKISAEYKEIEKSVIHILGDEDYRQGDFNYYKKVDGFNWNINIGLKDGINVWGQAYSRDTGPIKDHDDRFPKELAEFINRLNEHINKLKVDLGIGVVDKAIE